MPLSSGCSSTPSCSAVRVAFATDVLEGHAPGDRAALAVGGADRGVGVAPALVLVEVREHELNLFLAHVPRFQPLELGHLGLACALEIEGSAGSALLLL